MDSLAQLVASFAGDPQSAGALMRNLLRADSDAFLASALPILRDAPDSPGVDAMLDLMVRRGLTVSLFADPELPGDEEAVALARRIMRADPCFDLRLLEFAEVGDRTRPVASAVVRRILHVVAAVSDRRRAAPRLVAMLRRADDHVRSRAALLLGTATRNCAWAFGQLRDPDTRVRANVVESLWGLTSSEARHFFREAAADPHNRVVGNALFGLYRCGLVESVRLILEMAGSQSAAFRASAAWVMGKTEDPRFLPRLNQMLADNAAGVRSSVLRALSILRRIKAPPEQLRILAVPRTAWPNPQVFVIDVSDSARRPVADLPALAFTLWLGDTPIAEYDVTPATNTAGRYVVRADFEPGAEARVEVRTEAAWGSSSLANGAPSGDGSQQGQSAAALN